MIARLLPASASGSGAVFFSDASHFLSWAAATIRQVGNVFDPAATATRAQAAKVVAELLQMLVKT